MGCRERFCFSFMVQRRRSARAVRLYPRNNLYNGKGNRKCQPRTKAPSARYDEAFKAGQCGWSPGRPSREVAAESGICIDTLQLAEKRRAHHHRGQADHQNRDARRLRELEIQHCARSLKREKRRVIDIKIVGIAPTIEDKYRYIVRPAREHSVELAMPTLLQRVLRMAGRKPSLRRQKRSKTEA